MPSYLFFGDGPAPEGFSRLELDEAVPGSVSGIYCAGMLERMTVAEAARFLRGCRRVLEPGGLLRVETLDLAELVRAYHGEQGVEWTEDEPAWCGDAAERLNSALRSDGRRFVADEAHLRSLFELAGLEARGRVVPSDRTDARLASVEPRVRPLLLFDGASARGPLAAEPLVSVVITAYNEIYFADALASALSQTYRRFEVIVGDDSPGDLVRRAVEAARDDRVRYVRNTPRLHGPANRIACFDRARGELIKFLNDDDLLEPDCLERMVRCLASRPSATLVTSRRKRIDAAGRPMEDGCRSLLPPVADDSVIDGSAAAAALVLRGVNFIGEPSTVMFRRADLAGARPHILSYAGRPCIPNGDVTMWTALLSKGDLIYLVEPLSSFRTHPGQQQRQPGFAEPARRAWRQMADAARATGLADPGGEGFLPSVPLGARPWWPAALRELVEAALDARRRGLLDVAASSLEAGVALAPAEPWPATLLGRVLAESGRNREALAVLEGVRARAPEYVPAMIETARALAVDDDPTCARARALVDRAQELAPLVSFRRGVGDAPCRWLEAEARLAVDGCVLPARVEIELESATAGSTSMRPFAVEVAVDEECLGDVTFEPGSDMLHAPLYLGPADHHPIIRLRSQYGSLAPEADATGARKVPSVRLVSLTVAPVLE